MYRNMISSISKTGGIVVWFLFEMTTSLLAQTLKTTVSSRFSEFQNISIDDGLSQSVVNAIIQDHNGFMWFGTQDGLNKYDGHTVSIYKHNPLDSNSISGNDIRVFYLDEHKNLWIGIYAGGINRLNLLTGEIVHFKHDRDDENSLPDNNVWKFIVDNAGVFWIASEGGGLISFDPEEKKFNQFRHNPNKLNSLSNDYVRSIFQDSKGDLWIGTEDGLNKLNCIRTDEDSVIQNREYQFQHFKNKPKNPNSLSNNSVWAIAEDSENNLWIGTHGGGLNRFDQQTQRFKRFQRDVNNNSSINSNEVWSIYEDSFGNLLVGTLDGGLNIFDPKTEKFRHVVHDPQIKNSIANNSILTFFTDSSERLWIGTFGGGISKSEKNPPKFNPVKVIPGKQNGLNHNSIQSFYVDQKEALWVGTWGGGLNKFDRQTNNVTHYLHNPDENNSLSANAVMAIDNDKAGNLWLGTWGGGLNKFTPSTGKFVHYKHNPDIANSLNDDFIMTFLRDKNGILWIGTRQGGLNKFDPKTQTFSHYKHDPENTESISHNFIMDIYEIQDGTLWIGTMGGGLNEFDIETGKFKSYKHNPEIPGSLSDNGVLAIHKDIAENLWVGTKNGLNKFDYASSKFIYFFEQDGLPNNVIMGILEDDNGSLWLSTNKGLSKYTEGLEGINFRNYEVSDGLQSNEFSNGAFYKSETGQLFLGGINGFNAFSPDQVIDNPSKPKVVLTGFRKFNKPAQLDTVISEIRNIELTYDENFFSFDFAALDFTNPEKNKYAHKMVGFDKDWIQSRTKFASYTNLNPGQYIFRVKGSNNDGVWNETGTSVKITILPPWWRTTWAYFVYAVVLVCLLYAARRMEISRLKMRGELEKKEFKAQKLLEVDQLKSRFFANISHEFRTPLTLIIGPLEDLLEKTKNKDSKESLNLIQRNAKRVLSLINQLLDLSRLESGKMMLNAKKENIVEFLRGLVMAFASLAEQKNIALNFEACDDFKTSPEQSEIYFDSDKIEKIFFNLLSNAFKFTSAGGAITVSISFQADELPGTSKVPGNLKISVKDTGIGIPSGQLPHVFDRFFQVDGSSTREHSGSGIGLALTKELVELHKGKIEVQSEMGIGAEFTVWLPKGNAHLTEEEIIEDSIEIEKTEPKIFIPEVDSEAEVESLPAALQDSENENIILIVDDHKDVRHYIRKHLEEHYKIVESDNGADGLEKASELVPDLVISDVMMPKMNGYEFCAALKTDEKTSHIPVILLTARAGEKDKLAGLETGADDYLTKPFSSKEMLVRVSNLIEQRRKLRQRFMHEGGLIQPSEVTVTSVDKAFFEKIISVIEEHMEEEEFGVEMLSLEMNIGRRQLHRKISAITNLSPTGFIRSVRLQRARQLLEQEAGTVSEIAFQTGFNSLSYFSKAFQKQFGMLPSELNE